jgi:hypothetical protein
LLRRLFKQWLVPTLCRRDIIVIDSLATHKVTGVCDSIEATDTQRLYLPPYPQNFNPSKGDLPSLRLLYAVCRTIHSGFMEKIGSLLHSFSPQECSHSFAHAGYGST